MCQAISVEMDCTIKIPNIELESLLRMIVTAFQNQNLH